MAVSDVHALLNWSAAFIDHPPIYPVTFDDGTGVVGIGSISECISHTQHNTVCWHWGVTSCL